MVFEKVKIRHYILLFFALILLFFASRTVVNLIPSSHLRKQISKSMPQLLAAGDYPQVLFTERSQAFGRLDVYTEMSYLNNIVLTDSATPFREAVLNVDLSSRPEGAMKVEALSGFIDGSIENASIKPRGQYWWGALVIMRPLLSIMTYDNMNRLWQGLFYILFVFTCIQLYRRVGKLPTVCFLLGMVFVTFQIIPMIFTTSFAFILAFVGILMVLRRVETQRNIPSVFFLLGMLTAFFDWNSTPIVTFALPAICLFTALNKKAEQASPPEYKPVIILCIKIVLAWGFAYFFSLLAKWVVAVMLDPSMLENILLRISDGVNNRVSWAPEGFWPYLKAAYASQIRYLLPFTWGVKEMYRICAVVFAIMVVVFLFFRKPVKRLLLPALVFISGLAPLAWTFVFKAHVFIHCWFTYRSMAATIMAIGLSFALSLDVTKIKLRGSKQSAQ